MIGLLAYMFAMPRSNRSGDATRARILEAAADTLAIDGFGGFTLQAVAKRAGIQYGNLTHHYATRDILIDAMFENIVAHYREAFLAMVNRAESSNASVRDIVRWLIDDSVSGHTAPVFLQLWAMASHLPDIAAGMERLYDGAVDAFMEAQGLAPHAPQTKDVRDALYLLGTVLEGSSAIFFTRDRTGQAFRNSARDVAVDTIATLLEERIAKARAGT
jgi:AcrR family transcriptional regulator